MTAQIISHVLAVLNSTLNPHWQVRFVLLYLGSFNVLGNFVEVAVQLCQFGLHHLSAGGPPAGHQDDGLVLHIVHTQTDVLQLL